MNYRRFIMVIGLMCFIPFNASAIILSESSELHGFISQGYVYSPDNPYAGMQAESGSFDFREIGINGFWEANESLRFAGQLISRRLGESDNGDIRLDFLFADYLVSSDEMNSFGIRLGRVKNAVGLYNSTRDIPGARPGVYVPHSIYFDSFRDSLISTDGINLYGSARVQELGLLTWEAYAGKNEMDSFAMEYYLFGHDVAGSFKDVDLSGLFLNYRPDSTHDFNIGLSLFNMGIALQETQTIAEANLALQQSEAVTDSAVYALTPVAQGGLGYSNGSSEFLQFVALAAQQEALDNYTSYLTEGSANALLSVLSVQYGYQDWLLSAEYLNVFTAFEYEVLGEKTRSNTVTEGFFVQAEWFASQSWQAMLRYEELYLLNNDRSGSRSATQTNPFRGFGRGLNLGVKWNIDQNWAFMAQAAVNEGSVWLPGYKGIEETEITKHWRTYMMQLTYQF